MTFSVFGYGSLVNRLTLPPIVNAERATVRGWRRAWCTSSRTGSRGVCALSVVPDASSAIDGLIITFADEHWPSIRAREFRYDPLTLAEFPGTLMFRAKPEADRWGDAAHPVHLSYVDTTLQGFVREFGVAGAERFMASTDGWHVPMVDDRAAPTYPRVQRLHRDERATVDRLLATVDVRLPEAEYDERV